MKLLVNNQKINIHIYKNIIIKSFCIFRIAQKIKKYIIHAYSLRIRFLISSQHIMIGINVHRCLFTLKTFYSFT